MSCPRARPAPSRLRVTLRLVSRALCVVGLLLGAVFVNACGGGSPAVSNAAADAAQPSSDARVDAHPSAAADGGASDAPAEQEQTEAQDAAVVFAAADPALTRALIPYPAQLVGTGTSSCSNGFGAATDRWCAFSRPAPDGKRVELWAFNFTRASAASMPPACDGTSADCVRLATNLWTDRTLEGRSHPAAQRFDGETLIFHAEAPAGERDTYQGPVFAWRPGWTSPAQLTSSKGLTCQGDRRHAAVYCLDAAVFEKSTDTFSGVRVRSFDLRAGVLGAAPPAAPLALVEHLVANGDADLRWAAAFSPQADRLVYSYVPAGAKREAIRMLPASAIGAGVGTLLSDDGSDWRISHDGQRVYHLAGIDPQGPIDQAGDLRTVPVAGGSLATLRSNVIGYDLLGAHDDVVTDADRGIVFAEGRGERAPAIFVMRDSATPGDVAPLPAEVRGVQVSTDLRHTLYFKDVSGGSYPNIHVMKNDGSGGCVLNRDRRSETYFGHFSDSGSLVSWIEYGGDSEQGWYADPSTCGAKRKFGDYVTWYKFVDDDYAIFQGTDALDSAYHLEYARLLADAAQPRELPKLIDRDIDEVFSILGRGRSVYVLYSLSRDDASTRGIFVHGPLP